MNRTVPSVCLMMLLAASAAGQPRTIGGCTIFPANNIWNTRVDNMPVSANSAAFVTTIGASANLFPDFWSVAGGIFLNIAPASTPRVPVKALYAAEADPGPIPYRPTPWCRMAVTSI